jgi:hypothetical protein
MGDRRDRRPLVGIPLEVQVGERDERAVARSVVHHGHPEDRRLARRDGDLGRPVRPDLGREELLDVGDLRPVRRHGKPPHRAVDDLQSVQHAEPPTHRHGDGLVGVVDDAEVVPVLARLPQVEDDLGRDPCRSPYPDVVRVLIREVVGVAGPSRHRGHGMPERPARGPLDEIGGRR